MGILELSDRLCLPRLVTFCELYVSKTIEKACLKNIEEANIDIIGLLYFAQDHSASQVSLHDVDLFMSLWLFFSPSCGLFLCPLATQSALKLYASFPTFAFTLSQQITYQ